VPDPEPKDKAQRRALRLGAAQAGFDEWISDLPAVVIQN
jgi:hypothetical protein